MITANLELCKELYALSGLDKTEPIPWDWLEDYDYKHFAYWYSRAHNQEPNLIAQADKAWVHFNDCIICPAYTLGYLLHKLLTYEIVNNSVMVMVSYYDPESDKYYLAEDPDLTNSACKLLIELYKKGVFKADKVLTNDR